MNPDFIINAVCRVFPATPADIASPRRRRHEAEARQVACHLLFTVCRMSNTQIGRLLNRDDSSVATARRTYRKLYEVDKGYRAMADRVLAIVAGGKEVAA